MMLYVLPIMGGGNGAGAVPLSEIYHSVTGRSREEYYSTAIAILTIANIFAIIFAALLDMIGKNTRLSGEGELVRKASFKTEDDEKAGQITHRETAVGMVLSTTCFLLAYVVAKNSAKHRRRLYSLLRTDGPDCCCAERIRSLLTGD